VQIAEYERDSLGLRADSSPGCRPQWLKAYEQADLVVANLRSGDDAAASRSALQVGPAWKRAADCEGWPTPIRTAAPGEVNYPIIDSFTLVHFGVGALLSILGASQKQTLAISLGWELFERPLKRTMPRLFPHTTQDTIPNMVGDLIANELGYLFMESLK